jgi:mercuric reductase
MDTPFDFLILGSGSTAFAAAIKANELGVRVGMVERRTLGGTCANRGCLPSKNLIEAARIAWEAGHPRYPGLRPAAMEIDFADLIGQKDEVVRDYRAKRYQAVADGLSDFELLTGDAHFEDAHTVSVDGRRVEADRFLIATGSRPTVPSIPGLDSVPYLTSDLLDADEPGRLAELPRSLVVVGGGYVAVELAQMFARLGSRVTIVERSERLLAGYEPEIGDLLAEIFRGEDIEVLTGATTEAVGQNREGVEASLRLGYDRRTVAAERLLVATGRTPNTDGLSLDTAGVGIDREGHVAVNAELRTDQAHIWAAGDVVGRQHGSQLATPVGARQGRIAAENAFADAKRRFDGSVIPRVVFTDPPIGTVGLTEAEVRAKRFPAVAKATPLAYVPRAGAIHRTEGFVKFIASTIDERVLGVHIVGTAASEVIGEAAMAMHFRATLNDFIDLVHVYPTMNEALKIGAQAFSRDVTRLSCCAE